MRAPIAGCLGKDQGPQSAQVSGILGLPDEGGFILSLSRKKKKKAIVNTACSRGDPIMTLIGRRCFLALSTLHMHPAMLSSGPEALPTWKSPAGVPRVQRRVLPQQPPQASLAVTTCPFLHRKRCGVTAGLRKELCCLWSKGQLVHYSWLQTTPLNMLPRSQAAWSHGAG